MLELLLRRPAISLAVGISAVGAIGLLILAGVAHTFGLDFSVYYRAAVEPASMVYAPHGKLPFPYAPTMLLWVKPLSLIPFWLAFVAWVAFSVGVFALACRPHLPKSAILLALASPPVIACLTTGQVSVAMAALLLWACGTDRRFLAGAALAVLASVKPQLVYMAPIVLLLDRDSAAIAGGAVATLALVLLSVVLFGAERWVEWIASLKDFSAVLHSGNVLLVAITPAGVAERFGLPGMVFGFGGLAFGLWIVVRLRGNSPVSEAAAIASASLLGAPYALTHDLAAVVPFLIWAVWQGRMEAAAALSAALNPLPLLLTAYCLPSLSDGNGR